MISIPMPCLHPVLAQIITYLELAWMEFTLVVRIHGDSDLVRIEVFGRPSPEFAETVHIVCDCLDFNPICYRDRATLLSHISREGMQSPLMF